MVGQSNPQDLKNVPPPPNAEKLTIISPLSLSLLQTFKILTDNRYWAHTSQKESVPAWTMDPTQSEMAILSNGKSHDLEGDLAMPMKTLPEEDQ